MNTMRRRIRVGMGIGLGAGALLAGVTLVSAAPAFADNDWHTATSGSTVVERCAGCHRTHAAKASKGLITDQVALCTSCHAAGVGALTDVMMGWQYPDFFNGFDMMGLRSGGFQYALIDSGNADKFAALKKVPVLTTPVAVTSSHSVDGSSQTAWGGGAINSGVGNTINLTCGSCHDPHGNGNYRILRAIPNGAAVTAVKSSVSSIARAGNVATVTTGSAHGFVVGQRIGITGLVQYPAGTGYNPVGWNGTWVVVSVPTATSLTFAMTGADLATTTAYGGFVQPAGIADSARKTYVTFNYWAPDDDQSAATSVTYGGVSKPSSGFISGISEWCSTCHTRYLATSGSASTSSGDTTYTFRHTSDQNFGRNTSNPNANCITCHVAHGSNAKMDGASTSVLKDPSGANPSNGSRLLRVDNRGTCNMCHGV